MRGGNIAAVASGPAPARPPLRVVTSPEDWILTPPEVDAWLARAKAGDRLVYGRGQQIIRGHTQQLLKARADAGDVYLFQPRSIDRPGFDFIAVKRIAPPALPCGPRAAAAGDPAMATIYNRLKRAAQSGERCPSNVQLAALVGLNEAQVKWRIRKLVDAGRIATRVVPSRSDPMFRIVTIVTTGRETAAPAYNRLTAGAK